MDWVLYDRNLRHEKDKHYKETAVRHQENLPCKNWIELSKNKVINYTRMGSIFLTFPARDNSKFADLQKTTQSQRIKQ